MVWSWFKENVLKPIGDEVKNTVEFAGEVVGAGIRGIAKYTNEDEQSRMLEQLRKEHAKAEKKMCSIIM